MIYGKEHRYPFLSSARMVMNNAGVDIDSLLTKPEFELARTRGIQRITDALDSSNISSTSHRTDFDKMMEILSYPYARILVSCINDNYLLRRYALAEAVHMNEYLGHEDAEDVQAIAQELGVDSILDEDKLRMGFADYLKYSTRIKSVEWKLINSNLKNGYVTLDNKSFTRLLQNALQDRIESELPLKNATYLEKDVAHVLPEIKQRIDEAKSRFEVKFSGNLDDDCIPPCIRTLLSNASNGINLGHSGRFALVAFLNAIGMNYEQIITVFSRSPDFDESKSSYQIKHITGELSGTDGYSMPGCGTMLTNGNCYNPDQLCGNEKVNHPLTYFRIKSRIPKNQTSPSK